MARVVETDEPAVREERTVVNNDGARSGPGTGLVIAIVIIILLIIALFVWRPWGGSSGSSGGTDINVTAPASGSGQ